MSGNGAGPAGIDTSAPNVARIYDYILGGKDNFAADRRPADILCHPDVLARLDFSQPVGVLCACALHFVPDEDEPHQIIAGYRDHLAPGSFLAITHGITAATPEDDPDGAVESVTSVYRNASAQMQVRPVKEIERFFKPPP